MWEVIQANKRKSILLIVGLGIVLALLGGAIGTYLLPHNPQDGIFFGVIIAMIIWIVMMLINLAGGEKILLATAGAREVKHDDAPQLYNIVEEMKIASGLPVLPRVYIIDSHVPNAFAVGLKPERAAVAVTTGLLGKLNRDELQGVIAHEMAHIVNRDTLFMTIAAVTVGAVVILADLFLRGMWYSSFGRRRSRDSGQLGAIIMVVSIVLAILSPLLAQLLYFATSRRREYLADASAAQFTRYPEGLASALEKIASRQSKKFSKSRALAPMFIVNPMAASGRGGSLFSTHPPTEDRIRVLRSMAKDTSLLAYEQAFRELHKGSGVFSPGILKTARQQEARPPSEEARKHDPQKSWREAKEILHKMNGMWVLACSCGLNIKIPPDYEEKSINCPRCGKTHQIPEEFFVVMAAAGLGQARKRRRKN